MPQTKKQEDVAVDPRVLRALGHPLRQRILHALNTKVASPSALSEELGERLANVSYHVKILLENDAIELVKTEPVRGALEHFYRATMRPYLDDAHWARIPASTRRALFDSTLQRIWDEARDAAEAKQLDDPSSHISHVRLSLDEQAYRELTDHLAQTLELAMRLEADSRRRKAGGHGTEHETVMALMQFRRDARD